MRWKQGLVWTLSAMALTSCGGGETSGGSVAVVPPTPAPVVSTPPPPPTATLRAYASASSPAFFYFYPTEEQVANDVLAGGYGNRSGQYFPGFTNTEGLGRAAFGNSVGTDLTARSKAVAGVDSATSQIFVFKGSGAARVITPMTSILYSANGNQAKLKRVLGLSNSVFALQTDPDILTYDAISELASTDAARKQEAGRMIANNIRAMLVVKAINRAFRANRSQPFIPDFIALGRYIETGPDSFIFTNANMSAFLQSLGGMSSYRADVVSAAAHLINAYAAAIGVSVTTPEQTSRFALGIDGYLFPQLDALFDANSSTAATAALLVTSQTILDETVRYSETTPFNTTGHFFPGPDFYTVEAGSPLTIPTVVYTSPAFTTTSYAINDVNANGPTGSIGFFPSSARVSVQSVNVPASNAQQLSVQLRPDSSTLVTPLNGFKGVTYFDYTARHEEGEERIGRVYVRVR